MAAFEAEPKGAQPLQIIRLVEDVVSGEQDGKCYQFQLVEENLELILGKVPDNMKVSVVSVVGNFRTGKSFLLTFMLRFLRNFTTFGEKWQESDGETLRGCSNASAASGEEAAAAEHKGFEWRGGHERMTTGIWMYSEPFEHTIMGGEKIAVLVVDTQGLFDNETTMLLTSCIFGLSTLMSSYQIYNVKERIGEDNLQQLALFSEYGRMALDGDGEADPEGGDASAGAEDEATPERGAAKAFQKLEFLVRDWPNFEEEHTEEDRLRFMDEYVHEVVVKSRDHKDLADTREQILSCFQQISCFLLPHPGTKVIKPKYDGRVDVIDPEFRDMLTLYMQRIFNEDLEPKRISGRELTAPELAVYIKTYVKLFQDGSKFPEAKTVLQATAEANNRNALTLALKKYTQEMDKKVGANKTKYITKTEFDEYQTACYDGAMRLFDTLANMGSKTMIKEAREELVVEMQSAFEKYATMNRARNPWQNAEQYIIPLFVATTAFILRYFTDSCSSFSDICKNSSHFLGHIYVAIFVLMVIVSAGRIKQGVEYFKEVAPLLVGVAKQKTS